jgi:EF hand domain-containing protein
MPMKLAIAAVVAAILATGSAFAGDDPDTGKDKTKPAAGRGEMLLKLFEKADTNGDGKLSLEEFKTALENAPKGKLKDKPEAIDKLFKKIDANGDGFITKEEMKKFVEKLQSRQGQKKPNKP